MPKNGDPNYSEMLAHAVVGREVVKLVQQSGLLVRPQAKGPKPKAKPAAPAKPAKSAPAKSTDVDPDDD